MILSIDPGSEQSAWCEYTRDDLPMIVGKAPNVDVLQMLRDDPSARRRGNSLFAATLAIEMVASYGMAVGKDVFETVRWIGRFQEAWEARGGKVRLVYRREVKLYLCESVKANDANIRAAIIDRYGPGKDKAIGKKVAPGPLYGLKGDEWSALAVALTAAA